MDKATALSTLKLPPSATRSDILAAFTRLARRYPLQQFPERHTRLLEAKKMLLNPEAGVKEILFGSEVDMSWLNHYICEQDVRDASATEDAHALHACVEALCRPHLQKGRMLCPLPVDFPQELDELLAGLGPEGVMELLNKFN